MKAEKTNLVELIILLLLKDEVKSGVDLNSEYGLLVERDIGTSIYVLLNRMVAKKFIVTGSTNTYPFKGYEITDAGKKIFDKYYKIFNLKEGVRLQEEIQ